MSELNIKKSLESWIKEKNVVDIRFFPKNPSVSSVDDILAGAHQAIVARSRGECYSYVDAEIETFLD